MESSSSGPGHTHKAAAHRAHYRLLVITAILCVVAAAIMGYVLWRDGMLTHRLGSGTVDVTIARAALPLTPLTHVDKHGATQVIVAGQGNSVLIDASANYYLIADPAHAHVSLYKSDPAHSDAGLSELTHTQTLKYDLTYDALSGTAAYVSASSSAAAPHVTYWSPLDGKEKDLGAGTSPTLLPGGFFVVTRAGSSLVSVNTQTGARSTLVSIDGNAAFAVDRAHLVVTIYDPVRREFQEYSVGGMTSASYVSAHPAPDAPIALAYDGSALVAAYPDARTGQVALTIGKTTAALPIAAGSSVGTYKLEMNHD